MRQFLVITRLLSTFLSKRYALNAERTPEVTKLHAAAVKCLILASSCRSRVVAEACTPLLKLVPVLFESVKMTIFDVDTRQELLSSVLQDVRSGKDNTLFLLYQFERTVPYIANGKPQLTTAILSTLSNLYELLKPVKEVRDNIYQIVLRLYGSLVSLPLTTEQLADLVRLTVALTGTLSTKCKSFGSLRELVSVASGADA